MYLGQHIVPADYRHQPPFTSSSALTEKTPVVSELLLSSKVFVSESFCPAKLSPQILSGHFLGPDS